MALIVLFSTFSFAVDQHYCGDVLVDFSVFGKAESCGMISQEVSETDPSSLMEGHCCSDEIVAVSGQDNLNLSLEKLSFEQPLFMAAFVYAYIHSFNTLNEKVVPFTEYASPPITRDIITLDQVYLI